MVTDRLMTRAESWPQADGLSEGRLGAGPSRGPRRGGERSVEDAALLQLVGNSERGGGAWCRCAPQPHSDLRQHAGEHLQAQILLVSQTVGAALDHADLVVEPLHESQRHLVLD